MRKGNRWTGPLLAVVMGLGISGIGSGTAFAETPNDPYYSYQAEKLGYAKIPGAWAHTTGNPALTVAVLSTGVDTDHPDLKGVLVPGYNALDGTANVEDTEGRGTMMAGLIGAARNNSVGIAGTADVKIMPVKVKGSYVSSAKVADGLRFAVDHGAKIIVSDQMTVTDDPVLRDAVEYAHSKGIVVVAATGDGAYGGAPEGRSTYPAAYDHVIAVGGTERSGGGWWDHSEFGSYVDLVGPAQYLYTLSNDGGQVYGHSTAMSAALVGGVSALLLSVHPDLTPDQVELHLRQTAKDLGVYGYDPHTGYGMVDAEAAVTREIGAYPAPLLTLNGDENDPLFPDGLQNARINFTLGEPANVSIMVVDANGSVKAPVLSSTDLPAGTHSAEWDGRYINSDLLPAGTYTYVVEATGSKGAVRQTGTIEVLKAYLTIDHWKKRFNSDGTSVDYKLLESAYVWHEIYDAERRLIRAYPPSTWAKINESWAYWDGKDVNGQQVPEGVYTFRVGGTTVSGVEMRPLEVTAETDYAAPVLDMQEVRPFETGKQNAAFVYSLNERSWAQFEIFDLNDVHVAQPGGKMSDPGVNQIEWNGLNANQAKVKEGWYKYKVIYADTAGNYGVEQTGQVYADTVVAAITNVSDSADPFKVTGTTTNTIKFTLNEAMKVKVTVLDAAGQLVRTLSDSNRTLGAHSVAWDGKNAAGQLTAEGLYTYRIEALDNFNRPVPAAEGTIRVDRFAPAVSESSLTPNPFAPDGTNRAALTYKLSEDAKVTAGIYTGTGTLVKSLTANAAQTAGEQTLNWDGKNASGVLAGDDTYTYRITAVDAAGWTSVLNSGTFTVEGKVPTLTNVKDSADPFKVTGTSTSTISYTLSEPATVNVRILDEAGQAVRQLFAGKLTAGTKSTAWNGKDDAGALVPDGLYNYEITAIDAAGKAAMPALGTITTDKTTPVISSLAVSDQPVDTTAGGAVDISYALSEQGKVTVGVYNSANMLVKTLISNTLQSQTQALTWDGKNSSNLPVGDGVYTIKVTATDLAGWTAAPVSKTVTLEGRVPELTAVSDAPDAFRPTGTTVNTIRYTLSENASVSVIIYDEAGQAVKKLHDAQTLAGSKSIAWNGKNESGAIVGSGTYTYRIAATDAFGKTAEASGTILVDVTAPAVTDLTISENPFAPLGTNTTEIRYTLDENAKVSVAVLNSSNAVVRSITANAAQTAGSNAVLWNGKNSSNLLVAAGTYTVRVTAVDSVGNTTIQTATVTAQ